MIHHTFTKTTKSILVVFCFLIIFACKSNSTSGVEIIYESEKAIAVSYDSEMATDKVKVFLKSNITTPLLGDTKVVDGRYVFEPIIPFSPGETYTIYNGGTQVSEFTIASSNSSENPELTAIYPSTDTVPENLLKMYFQFSQPMQEVGNALDYISIINKTTGEEVDVFLELNTELWNKEHTRLTLWLDPGRIKTDLIPNKELGLPILKGNIYTLTVSNTWKDAQGNPLKKAYTKTFKVIDRDAEYPITTSWQIDAQPDVLTIHFNESLDGVLAAETFRINSESGESVEGEFELIDNEKTLKFHPKYPFTLGNYVIVVESKLEDLAGNNLNHPFDKDLTKTYAEEDSETKTLRFVID